MRSKENLAAKVKKSSNANAVIFVVGPTAVGKSAVALMAAKKTAGVIVNADSLQVYRGMDIGTAKPDALERKQVPHFLFDICEPNEPLSAADYRRRALQVIEDHVAEGPVFVVGGSGFYLQALEKGVYAAPAMSAEMRARLESETSTRGLLALYQDLKNRDPVCAAKISPNDAYRIHRALGLIYETGRTTTAIREDFLAQQKPFPFPLKKVGLTLDRDELRKRVSTRVRAMLEQGLIDEVKTLIAHGFKTARALQSVGYRQVVEVLDGKLDQSELQDLIVLRTMQLAKRQMTWFRADPMIRWFADVDSALEQLV